VFFGERQLTPETAERIEALLDEDIVNKMRETGLLRFGDAVVEISGDKNPLLVLWKLAKKQSYPKLPSGDHLDVRHEATGRYAWAVPTRDAIQKIAKYQPIVEMGAGTGFLAYLLEQIGVRVDAYDGFEKSHFG